MSRSSGEVTRETCSDARPRDDLSGAYEEKTSGNCPQASNESEILGHLEGQQSRLPGHFQAIMQQKEPPRVVAFRTIE
jgi:hypothetical protein